MNWEACPVWDPKPRRAWHITCCGRRRRRCGRWLSDTRRDQSVICVVEEAQNITPIERSAVYRGLYHVLDGVLDPLSGIGPENLRIKELLQRIKDGEVREIIIATNPKVEGDATALYLAKLITPLGIKITRIARGIPVGSDLDFADEVTLGRAIEGRTEL
jgi:recombination protein RecR